MKGASIIGYVHDAPKQGKDQDMITLRTNRGRSPMDQPATAHASPIGLQSRIAALEVQCRTLAAKCEDARARGKALQSRVMYLEDFFGVTKAESYRERCRIYAVEVVRLAAAEMQLDVAEMVGPSVARPIARARWLAQLFMRDELKMSMPEIAKATGRADHTTIKYALGRGQDLMRESPEFAEHYAALKEAWKAVDVTELSDG